MAEVKRPDPGDLAKQIKAFEGELPHYEPYAEALKRVLKAACKTHLNEAVVSARPKSIASFAEKCVRRWETYPDAVRQMNDLCGARVIVQTLSQVEDVRRFVEEHFNVVETEDISLRLGNKEFGYRDRHYIVQLDSQKARGIGFTPHEISVIGERRAELQIRTWAQHAWADTIHDRTYKSPLTPTPEVERTTALIAALMEDGDRNFDRLANEIDSLVDNYAAHHRRKKVSDEIELNELIRQHLEPAKQLPLALKLAKLRAVLGQDEEAIALLEPHENVKGPLRDEILLELGTALCRRNRHEPRGSSYQRGWQLVKGVVDDLAAPQGTEVWISRRRSRLRARALSRLGWVCEPIEEHTSLASHCHRQALELEPANPYYLANVLGYELRGGVKAEEVERCLRPAMLDAIRACKQHGAQGLELPFAYFTAGRLRLLLGEAEEAFEGYLRGAHHCLDEQSCAGCELLDDEVAWLHRVWHGHDLPTHFRFAKEFLVLAKAARDCLTCETTGRTSFPIPRAKITGPVLIIGGGAATLNPATLDLLRLPLTDALRDFEGTVISGGTKCGIPGLVGEVAAALKERGERQFTVIGYRPRLLPDDAPHDERYDQPPVVVGETGFSAAQILANWVDILAARIHPREVRLLGIGGGSVAAVEYRMALAMGAWVGVLQVPKPCTAPADAVDNLLADPEWKDFSSLLPMPLDPATLRAFVNCQPPTLLPKKSAVPAEKVELMAQALHRIYLEGSQNQLPENLRPWKDLPQTYKDSNLAQAAYAVEILRAAGFEVREATGAAGAIKSFEGVEFEKDVERMAEFEHGRWNIERLVGGWRPGKKRDNEKRIHPSIVPWTDNRTLTPHIKGHDRNAVRAFPALLAKAGLEIARAR